jgi:hypothetical protein
VDEIKIYKSPVKALRLVFLASLFVAPCTYALITRSLNMPPILAWSGVSFFGLGLLYGLFNLIDRRPQIIINTEGLFDRMAYRDFINWSLIKDAYVFHINKQTFIGIVIDSAALSLIKRKGSLRLSKHIGFQEITLSLGMIKIDEQRFRDFIVAMSQAAPAKRTNLITQYSS